jgi:lysozyme
MKTPLLFGVAAFAFLMASRARASNAGSDFEPPSFVDEITGAVAETANRIMGTAASSMTVSPEMREKLKLRERLMLQRYELGDGGWTIGYGHFTPYKGNNPPPERITRDEAEAIFDNDIEERAMRWVRAYVTAPLTQSQFDALTSMAFNMSPGAFKTIADVVNAGEDPTERAMHYTRPDLPNLHQGLINRRNEELAWYFRDGVADNLG